VETGFGENGQYRHRVGELVSIPSSCFLENCTAFCASEFRYCIILTPSLYYIYSDYFPEGYDPSSVEFTEGMMGSQALLGGNRGGPELPGFENLGEDAVVMGGIVASSEIPDGMDFTPSSVPDGEFQMQVPASGSGTGACVVFNTVVVVVAATIDRSSLVVAINTRRKRRDRNADEIHNSRVSSTHSLHFLFAFLFIAVQN